MSEWQPIETAPVDGSVVLLTYRDGDSAIVTAGWYYEDSRDWWELNSHPSDYVDREVPNPTHWMSLPDPPAQTPSVIQSKENGG